MDVNTSVQAMRKRLSVRKYLERPITPEEMEQIQSCLNGLQPLVADIKTAWRIVPCKETNCNFNAEYCLVWYSENKPRYLENAGYMLEQWDLFMASIGLGVCWYGLAKPSKEQKQLDGLEYVIMLSFGKCDQGVFRTDDKQFKRMLPDEFWNGHRHNDVANLVRLAPSACNSQPWRIECDGDDVFVLRYTDKLNPIKRIVSKYFNHIDMGIFLHYLEVAFTACGYKFEIDLYPPEEDRLEVIAKYTIQK